MSTRYFGLPLSEIVRREKHNVPSIVVNVTDHICKQGIDVVGIFRPNGNAKALDRLRSLYDKTGDADLRTCSDIMTVAALLKVFLRELPDGLIPQKLTAQFVAAQDICIKDPQECLHVMRQLLRQLPNENYATLKYLMAFLVLVTLEEEVNKMSAMALAIVFGPAMFRCASGFEGLKEQGVTNYITLTFIMKYDALFLEDEEFSPYSPDFVLADCCKDIELVVAKPEVNVIDNTSDDNDSLCSPCSPTSPPPIDSESSETTSGRIFSMPARLQRAIRHAVSRHAFGEVASSSSDESENPDSSNPSQVKDLQLEMNPVRKTPGSIDASVSGIVRTTQIDRTALPVKKPVATIVPNSNSNARQSNVAVTVTNHTTADDVDAIENDNTSSSEESSSGSESPPPPVLPRQPFSKTLPTSSKGGEQLVKVVSKTGAVTGQPSTVIGKPRLPSPPSSLRHTIALPTEHQPSCNDDDDDAAEDSTSSFKKLGKQIKAAKRKIKDFEIEFEEVHGYKPSRSTKESDPDIKKCMSEVSSARKQLAELRRDSRLAETSGQKTSVLKPAAVKDGNIPSSMENTLAVLLRKLNDKRKEARRPEEIARMSMEDLKEEKICLQKALLHFETLHGRPSTVSEKKLMHPLYERYREIKRILARPCVSDDDEEDDEDNDNQTGGGSSDHGSSNIFGNTSFVSASTQNTVATVRTDNTLRTASVKSSSTYSNQNTAFRSVQPARNGTVVSDDLNNDSNGVSFHMMTTADLLTELERTQLAKKHLQIELHNFEQHFMKKHGRRLQREDRMLKESEYRQYKVVKSKLKLLEALLDKRERAKKAGAPPNGL